MRILVTGGTGFIGTHVLKQLGERGHEVVCFDLAEPSALTRELAPDATFVTGDISDPVSVANTLARFDPDRVVHLAAMLGRGSQQHPRQAFEVNVDGTIGLLELTESHGIDRVVAASSVSVYGDVPPDVDRLDETVPRRPNNVYGMTKTAVEHLGSTYQDRTGVEFAALQPVHGMGPGRLRGNVEDSFVVKAAVSGETLTVPTVEQPLEIIYVEDTARAFVAAILADTLPHDAYLVGTGEYTTLTEIVELVRTHVPGANLELGGERGADELPAHPPTDTSRIREDLGWRPHYTISEALQTYVEWLDAHPDLWSFDASDAPWLAE